MDIHAKYHHGLSQDYQKTVCIHEKYLLTHEDIDFLLNK